MSHNMASLKPAVMQKLRESLSNLLDIRTSDVTPEATISDLGIDSLMSHEVARELSKRFDLALSGEDLIELDDMESLCEKIIFTHSTSSRSSSRTSSPASSRSTSYTGSSASSRSVSPLRSRQASWTNTDDFAPLDSEPGVCEAAVQCMTEMRTTYDSMVSGTELSTFYDDVFPLQKQLVLSYILEAFKELGCDLAKISAGDKIPAPPIHARHAKVMNQYLKVLEDAELITRQKNFWLRTASPVDLAPSNVLSAQLIRLFPSYASENELCGVTGSRLAACLTGKINPLDLLNGPEALAIQEDFYANSPYLKTGISFLTQFLIELMSKSDVDRPLRILEIGAGSGGTTQHVLQQLTSTGFKFEFTFSDISPQLVEAGKKKFAQYDFVQYRVIDVEKPPPPSLQGHFDIVFSTNGVHATSNIVKATRTIKGMLQENGVLCLLEMMQKMPWFDVVFGLLERWWIFEDGRKYALVDEGYWDQCLSSAGYRWMDWSRGDLKESRMLRLLVASPSLNLSPVYNFTGEAAAGPIPWKETIPFKKVGDLTLEADLYYPRETQSSTSAPRPIALMIHGGSHVMLSKNDIRPQQTKNLIRAGFLPISVDYRLCPEVNVLDGAMADVRDAYVWIRETLASISRNRSDVKVDTSRVVIVGWSSGGHLAMTLGWTAADCHVPAPEAILAFYSQTDYEDSFWEKANIPRGTENAAKMFSNLPRTHLREGISGTAVASYNVPPEHRGYGGWMSAHHPRSRIALWATWMGKQREMLLQGLRLGEEFSPLDAEQVRSISPLAQIKAGAYKIPTFLIHGTGDDYVPWQQTKATAESLAAQGIDVDMRLVQGAEHVFDAMPGWQDDFERSKAVWDGYDFLKRYVVQ